MPAHGRVAIHSANSSRLYAPGARRYPTRIPEISLKHYAMKTLHAFVFGLILLAQPGLSSAQHEPAASIPAGALIQPADLAANLKSAPATRPLVLQVGFRKLYAQAHIPDSEYVGAASEDAGLQLLRNRVAKLTKDTAIVIYCGCCPWSHCPNIAAAYDELRALGFTRVKVLYIADNFGDNWVKLGYPVVMGQQP
jgi:thiosulfate/3-mercaptopyruvate sulfurtransferase